MQYPEFQVNSYSPKVLTDVSWLALHPPPRLADHRGSKTEALQDRLACLVNLDCTSSTQRTWRHSLQTTAEELPRGVLCALSRPYCCAQLCAAADSLVLSRRDASPRLPDVSRAPAATQYAPYVGISLFLARAHEVCVAATVVSEEVGLSSSPPTCGYTPASGSR
jgi:hypothetical protein